MVAVGDTAQGACVLTADAVGVAPARRPLRSMPKNRYSSAPSGALTAMMTMTQASFGAFRTDFERARLMRQKASRPTIRTRTGISAGASGPSPARADASRTDAHGVPHRRVTHVVTMLMTSGLTGDRTARR